MPIGEGHALAGQTIQIGRLELGLGVEAGSIPKALVVGVDHDDVWPLGGIDHGNEKREQ